MLIEENQQDQKKQQGPAAKDHAGDPDSTMSDSEDFDPEVKVKDHRVIVPVREPRCHEYGSHHIKDSKSKHKD